MAFCDTLQNILDCKVGLYNINGHLIEGHDIGFSYTDNTYYSNKNTYIFCNNHIVSINCKLSQDACNLVKLNFTLFKEHKSEGFINSLDYIVKNNIPSEDIKGKYKNYTVFYIKSKENICDILRTIYEGYNIELSKDTEGVYLAKQMDEVEQEAAAIIDGIWQEKGISSIIGCGRTVKDNYTIKDAAIHSKTSCLIAQNLELKEGFYHIDKMIAFGLMNSLSDDDINFYLNGGYEGFSIVTRDKELVDTAEQLFKCHLNISQASRNLYIHRNTLLYRIEKIKNLTSLDIKNFEDAMIFKTIIAILKLKKL